VGKSTACRRFVELACQRGVTVGGFLSIALFDEQGEKEGIKLLDPRTGDERLLASILNPLGGPQVGAYHMSLDTLEWGAGLALKALQEGVGLVLIDEIGPLELSRGEGFAGVLPALYASIDSDCLVVVRPELIDDLERRLKAGQVVRRIVTVDNRDSMPDGLAHLLWGAP
jgi:nucleoside-triphosphatase